MQLEGEFAREARPEHPHIAPAALAIDEVHVGQPAERCGPFAAEHDAERRTARGARDHDRRPGLRGVRERNIRTAPLEIAVVLEVRQHVLGVPRARRREEAIRCHPEHDAVIEHHAVLAQVHHVLAASDLDRARLRQVERIEERRSIGAGHLDLAERRSVEDAAVRAHARRLGDSRDGRVGAVRLVVPRAHPVLGVLKHAAVRLVPFVQRRPPAHPELLSDAVPRNRIQREGVVRRARAACAHVAERLALELGQDRGAEHAARPPLLRADAERRVALDVLDVDEPLGERLPQVRDGDVVLLVDELALLAARVRGRAPERLKIRGAVAVRGRNSSRIPGGARRARGLGARAVAAGNHGAEFERAARGPGTRSPLGLAPCDEGARIRRDLAHAALVKPRVHGRRPATRDEHRIAVNATDAPGRIERCDLDRAHAVRARGLEDGVSRKTLDPGPHEIRAQLRSRRLRRQCLLGANIDDSPHRDAGRAQARRREVEPVVIAEKHRPTSRRDAVARDQPFGGAKQEDARSIVVDEGDRSLDSAHGDDQAPRADAVDAIVPRNSPRHAVRHEEPVGAADDGRVGEETHAALDELAAGGLDPGARGHRTDRCRFELELPANDRLALADDDARAGARSRECGREASGAGTTHEHVARQVLDRRPRQVRPARRRAEAGEVADQRLVALPGRPDEGLVVEPGAEEPGPGLQHRGEVKAERRPAILAAQLKAIGENELRCRYVRDYGRGSTHGQKGIRLFGPEREKSARPPVLDAAAQEPHAVCKERRGGGIALLAAVLAPVERESYGLGRDPRTDPGRRTHGRPPPSISVSRT